MTNADIEEPTHCVYDENDKLFSKIKTNYKLIAINNKYFSAE